MYGKKVKLRAVFILSIFISLILVSFLVIKSLEENVVYFQSPTEVKELAELNKKKIRIGGMVKNNSISIEEKKVKFIFFGPYVNITYHVLSYLMLSYDII